MKKIRVLALIIMLLAVFIITGYAKLEAAPIELRYGTFSGPNDREVLKMKEIGAYVEKATEGRVTIGVYPSGVLGGGFGNTLDVTQKGVIDIGLTVFSFMSPKQLPFLMTGALPYVYRDAAGFLDAWEQENTLVDLANEYLATKGYDNVIFMGPQYGGFATLGFKNKEVRIPADLKGLKMRAAGLSVPVMEAYGAAPTAISSPEVYDALQRGIVDGTYGLAVTWVEWKWMEPINYHLNARLWPIGQAYTVNKSVLEKLSDADRAVVEAAIRWMATENTKINLLFDIMWETEVGKNVKSNIKPTDDEMKLWLAPKSKYIEDWLKRVGDRGKKALKVIEKYNKR